MVTRPPDCLQPGGLDLSAFTKTFAPFFGQDNFTVFSLWKIKYCHFTTTKKIPNPWRGRAGGQNQTVEVHFFLFGNPGIVIHPLKRNLKVTLLNKPWALVRKYLRLAPKLSASMMTAPQFLEGCHPYTCAASVWHVLSSSGAKPSGAKHKYLIFICLPMTWNDADYWSLRKHDCKFHF